MPRMSGLDVVREIGPTLMPVTVFVTAFDQYAIKAFDLSAVDYLVKPFRDSRFREALTRSAIGPIACDRTVLRRAEYW